MLYSEFCSKEVINLCDCEKLGRVVDFEMDECSGQILKIIVARMVLFPCTGCGVYD